MFKLLQVIIPAPTSFTIDIDSLYLYIIAFIIFAGVVWGLRKCIDLMHRS